MSRNNPGAETIPFSGPIPAGRYYIVEPYLRNPSLPFVSPTFYRLFRDDGVLDDQTLLPNPDDPRKPILRDRFRLHPGSVSLGCVTVSDWINWKTIDNLLKQTQTGVIPGTSIIYYGTITVR